MNRFAVLVSLLATFVIAPSALAGSQGDSLNQGHTETRTLVSAGLSREYRLFIPRLKTVSSPMPLVIVLHGSYGTGKKVEQGLGFNEYAIEHSFFVAYPDAYHNGQSRQTTRWNDGRGTLESTHLGVDDVAYISELITDISTAYPVDTRRVFVAGASNGGIMAYRIGCELRGKVRAIASVIGNIAAPLSMSCNPEPGLSVLSINGEVDPIIPLAGGEVCQGISKQFCEGGQVLSRAASLQYFAQANSCSKIFTTSRRPTEHDGTWVEVMNYTPCQNRAKIRSIVVHGMGHTWPPLQGQVASSGSSSMNLDATEEIVKFFMGL